MSMWNCMSDVVLNSSSLELIESLVEHFPQPK